MGRKGVKVGGRVGTLKAISNELNRGHHITNPNNALLLMAEILHQLIGSWSHYL